MTLNELKSGYFQGEIAKQPYIQEMHRIHRILFEYAEFLPKTDIKSIEITDNSVVMTSRSTGVKMLCDPADQRIAPIEILNFNFYEKTDFEMVKKVIKGSSVIFDIGANIGWYTINISKDRPAARIYAFEPIPKTFGYLKKNLDLNMTKNVHAFNFGFSEKEQKTEFYYYPEGSGNASMTNLTGSDNMEKIVCTVKNLDNFCSENKVRPDFIKCDVEGAELFVFRGGIRTLKQHKPIIFTELLRKWSAKFNYHPNDLIGLLRDIGYRCFTAKDKRFIEFSTVTTDTVENTFFFLHPAKHEDLIDEYVAPRPS
jgi:FkbM family methyltransferase